MFSPFFFISCHRTLVCYYMFEQTLMLIVSILFINIMVGSFVFVSWIKSRLWFICTPNLTEKLTIVLIFNIQPYLPSVADFGGVGGTVSVFISAIPVANTEPL